MSTPTLFVDRDGTLVEQPSRPPLDALAKVRFIPGVFAALSECSRRGYRLVMVSRQAGLGTSAFPQPRFDEPQQFILETFRSQDIHFHAVLICPHGGSEECPCHEPRGGPLSTYLRAHPIDPDASALIAADAVGFAAPLKVRAYTLRRGGSPEETWPAVTRALLSRRAHVVRETRETRLEVRVNLDAEEPVQASTGIGFLDHMLEQLAKHAGFALELQARGDLHIDEHHTVEDAALALGQALRQALGAKLGIARYGFLLPMDESEAQVTLDLSGRPFASFEGRFRRERVGALPTELVPHFFASLAQSLGATLHLCVRGTNAHHMIEACFKGVGRALRQALRRDGASLPSTKGML